MSRDFRIFFRFSRILIIFNSYICVFLVAFVLLDVSGCLWQSVGGYYPPLLRCNFFLFIINTKGWFLTKEDNLINTKGWFLTKEDNLRGKREGKTKLAQKSAFPSLFPLRFSSLELSFPFPLFPSLSDFYTFTVTSFFVYGRWLMLIWPLEKVRSHKRKKSGKGGRWRKESSRGKTRGRGRIPDFCASFFFSPFLWLSLWFVQNLQYTEILQYNEKSAT